MKKTLLGLTVTLLCSTFVLGQAKSNGTSIASADEQELRSLSTKWIEADTRSDTATIASLLAEEFSFVGWTSRSDYLEKVKLRDASFVIESYEFEVLQVQLYGDSAIVTSHKFLKVKQNGKPGSVTGYILSVWVKRNGRWQCVKACTH